MCENTQRAKLTTKGQVSILWFVECPTCLSTSTSDEDWFKETMGQDFPIEESDIHSEYEATCADCGEKYTITGFEQ